jgi:hypothetical protein
MWVAWVILIVAVVVLWWADVNVFFLSLRLKLLLVTFIALTIALTVTTAILSSAIEKLYEMESE